jgi:uncharacterized protein (UPF0261 family)
VEYAAGREVMSKKAYVVGTFDTKSEELLYVDALLKAAGLQTVRVDLSTQGKHANTDVTPNEVAAQIPGTPEILAQNDRGKSMEAMANAFARFIASRKDIAGIIGMGGSGNTTLVTAGMRALPVGLPKVMVSTQSGGYAGATDICMMYAVTDIAGLNSISRVVLANAAHALAGMIKNEFPRDIQSKPALCMTMFGVTTPCVTQIRTALEKEYDCIVFHATGVGGKSMEKLVDSGMITAAVDITTTEVADHLMDGVCSAGEDRFGAFIRTKIPYVGSVGALDMVNFGHIDSIPAQYKNRNLYKHNPTATLMRTTRDENVAMGKWIGQKLNACDGSVRFLVPEKGVSAIDAPGKPFHDPEADAALFETLEKTVKQTPRRRIVRLPQHINDAAFAAAAVEHLREIVRA